MTHTKGFRRRTRDKFARPFKRTGSIRMTNYLTKYRVGDYVDIIVDGSQHKGMPFKYYHGRTGRVFNINPRAIGVEIQKEVGSRYINKRVHVRLEHIRKSKCRDGFIDRIKVNDEKKRVANKEGKRISTKRLVGHPREAHLVKGVSTFIHPKIFKEVF